MKQAEKEKGSCLAPAWHLPRVARLFAWYGILPSMSYFHKLCQRVNGINDNSQASYHIVSLTLHDRGSAQRGPKYSQNPYIHTIHTYENRTSNSSFRFASARRAPKERSGDLSKLLVGYTWIYLHEYDTEHVRHGVWVGGDTARSAYN